MESDQQWPPTVKRGIALDMLPGIHLEFYPIMNLTAGVFSKHSYSIKVAQIH